MKRKNKRPQMRRKRKFLFRMKLIWSLKGKMTTEEKKDKCINNSKYWLHFLFHEFYLTVQKPTQIKLLWTYHHDSNLKNSLSLIYLLKHFMHFGLTFSLEYVSGYIIYGEMPTCLIPLDLSASSALVPRAVLQSAKHVGSGKEVRLNYSSVTY